MRTTKTVSAYWGQAKNGTWHKYAIDFPIDVAACNCSKQLMQGTMTEKLPIKAKVCKSCVKHHTFHQ